MTANPRWVLTLSLGFLLVSCNPDSDGPPVPGGPPDSPYSTSRKGGNGRHGLDHHLILFGIGPTEGPTAGGTDVLIVGFNFHQAGPVTEVLFGTEPALSFTVQSNNQIDAVTPPQGRGLVGVTVRNDIGEEATLDDIYEYVAPPPACLTLTPTSGPDTGGTDVTIETANFFDDFTLDLPDVYFDTALAASVTAIDATTLLVVTPPDPSPAPPPNVHPVDVTVESTGVVESCVFLQGFTYTGPTSGPCMYVTPPGGSLGGGDQVIIIAFGPCLWTPTSTVTFGGIPATTNTFISPTQLTCTTPVGRQPGPVDVEVTGVTQGGTDPCSCVLPNGYTYY